MVFVDIVKYIQDNLDLISSKKYTVSKERQLNSDNLEGEVVAKQLSGPVYDESATIPYQFEITSADPDKVIEDFTKLALQCNNKPFLSIVPVESESADDEEEQEETYQSYTITPFFQTPVVMNPEERYGAQVYSRLICFATFNITFQVSDIQSIEIDNEPIKYQSAVLAYTAELGSNPVSGAELVISKKKTASCSLSFQLINRATVFLNKCFKIATGQLKGNTSFSVKITTTNGMEATLKMVIGNSTLTSARMALPSTNIALYLYDDRGDINNG